MNMKLETLPNDRIAYVRQIGPYGPANAQAMEQLKKWAKEHNLLTESAILFGIPQDNPATTLPENCRYDVCIVLSKDYQVDDSVDEGEFTGGNYVSFLIKHTAEDIQRAWTEIFPALQSGGYQLDTGKPIVERYTVEMISNHLCEICVPIIAADN